MVQSLQDSQLCPPGKWCTDSAAGIDKCKQLSESHWIGDLPLFCSSNHVILSTKKLIFLEDHGNLTCEF